MKKILFLLVSLSSMASSSIHLEFTLSEVMASVENGLAKLDKELESEIKLVDVQKGGGHRAARLKVEYQSEDKLCLGVVKVQQRVAGTVAGEEFMGFSEIKCR